MSVGKNQKKHFDSVWKWKIFSWCFQMMSVKWWGDANSTFWWMMNAKRFSECCKFSEKYFNIVFKMTVKWWNHYFQTESKILFRIFPSLEIQSRVILSFYNHHLQTWSKYFFKTLKKLNSVIKLFVVLNVLNDDCKMM